MCQTQTNQNEYLIKAQAQKGAATAPAEIQYVISGLSEI